MRLRDIDALWDYMHENYPLGWSDSDAIEELINAPTVSTAPVRHGKWEPTEYAYCWGCSLCGGETSTGSSNYCPYCGAKMDLEG